MRDADDLLLDRFATACSGFGDRLGLVTPGQWEWPTPCSEWTVHQLVNHMTRGNLNYALLARGGTGEQFLALRDQDALGTDAVRAFGRSVAQCLDAFREPGALDRAMDYPLGAAPGRQLLAIRLTDTVVHGWDLARAAGSGEDLDPFLTGWILSNLEWIYRGIADSPIAVASSHRFFAAPTDTLPSTGSAQDRLLHLMGRI